MPHNRWRCRSNAGPAGISLRLQVRGAVASPRVPARVAYPVRLEVCSLVNLVAAAKFLTLPPLGSTLPSGYRYWRRVGLPTQFAGALATEKMASSCCPNWMRADSSAAGSRAQFVQSGPTMAATPSAQKP